MTESRRVEQLVIQIALQDLDETATPQLLQRNQSELTEMGS